MLYSQAKTLKRKLKREQEYLGRRNAVNCSVVILECKVIICHGYSSVIEDALQKTIEPVANHIHALLA